MRMPGSLESWELRRNIALNLLEAGDPPPEVAAAVGTSVRTIYRWRAAARDGGRDALKSVKPPGRTPRLSPTQKAELATLLLEPPSGHGYGGRYLWTQELIADLIQRKFGVKYHHDRVCRILDMIGFSHQKPARRARERDEAKIEAWRAEAWPTLLKKTPTPTA